MEERNELSDILLVDNEMGNKPQKRKKLLIIIALLVLLFVFVLIIMKAINRPNGPVSVVDDDLLPVVTNIDKTANMIDETTETEINSTLPTLSEIEEVNEANDSNDVAIVNEPSITTPVGSKPKQSTTKIASVSKGKYYIQIGSFSKGAPSKDFLQKVEQKNYNLSQEEAISNSKKIIKVFIGPYNTEKEARDVLPKIKQDIAKDAFLLKK